jgi:hypothetical protein
MSLSRNPNKNAKILATQGEPVELGAGSNERGRPAEAALRHAFNMIEKLVELLRFLR